MRRSMTRGFPSGSRSVDGGGWRNAARIRMRPSWSMHVSAVVGSLTAGEIAFKAMSTICKMPNSTSCCIVRAGPMSKDLHAGGVQRVRHPVREARPRERACPP